MNTNPYEPNQLRQPTPGVRQTCIRAPLARRGCASRWPLMNGVVRRASLILACYLSALALVAAENPPGDSGKRETRSIAGWSVYINKRLLLSQNAQTEHALGLLRAQLEAIARVVPASAVAQLRKVPLYISPEYPGVQPRAEYHCDAGWLREHGRDPTMAKGVEFTNIRIFEAETRRMPMFALHELAHAYHNRVLGFDHPGIKAAYAKAKAGGKYDRVERQDSEGRKRMDRAYALTNDREYFAESTEAFFGHNDFFPYTREQLKKQDPDMFALLEKVWNLPADSDTKPR